MEALLAILASFVIKVISESGYFGITVLMALESACIPIPSEVIMPFSGYLVFEGRFIFWQVVLWGGIGNLIGSWIAYFIGYYGGRPLIEKYGCYLFISPHDLSRADKWFERYGQKAAFLSRLLPVVRTFISLPAGISRMEFKRFSLYTLVGSLMWSFFLTYAGMILGRNWQKLEYYFHDFQWLIGGALLAGAIWWVLNHFKCRS